MIQATDLTRSFKTKAGLVEAVRGLSLQVEEGELVAFLGPNGAGKSTSVRMLTTLLPITSGSATVGGFDVARDPVGVRRTIGYVGQGTGSGPYHRVRDELVTQGRAYRMGDAEARRRADELLGVLELEGLADRNCATLSGGQKRRLDIALGLMHTPKILFLDEPSTGLDPHSRANLWEHVIKLRRQTGMTIFLTTHYLDEADTMAERVMIMDHGKMIADDVPEKLKADLAGDQVSLGLVSESDAITAAESAMNLPTVRDVTQTDRRLTFTIQNGETLMPEFIRQLHQKGLEVATANVVRPTLDDVFLSLTGRSLRESSLAVQKTEQVAHIERYTSEVSS
ncbi:ATP-binding cassette domain-containing protein [Natronospirillum operosum]|uniref:ATP-binding cassette domain-containing protein n=1 Tax=Natronospirillum operosum TaxID=2759953 RepID=A0A4Z0W6M7_9GAMM|nr:ATP-binding cassette domain-containing protein [Natronospirillum operosum]TGG92895.1 ATP-binding cassette domain-containing protein [Natronospirillum operosum]